MFSGPKYCPAVWSMSGDQGNQWNKAMVNVVESSDEFAITFEGMRGHGHNSDIAIDDIMLENGLCPEVILRLMIGWNYLEIQRFR